MSDEILTIDEVAKYLRVSERTVYEWAQKGEIPAGKIGNVWRFKKTDIEKWVDSQLSQCKKPDDTKYEIKLKHIISPERTVFTNYSTKHDTLITLIDLLSTAPQVKNKNELKKGILRREELMSTAIGYGIAVPHVRLGSVTDLVMAVAVSKKDITDFNALDEKPVRLVFMMVAGSEQHAYYLQLLSYFSCKLKNDGLAEKLLSAKTEREAYEILINI
ncbi:MAG: PTS fructose transporter subunit IIA [Treponema sp.]|nr:MAG: PTS fructose transporter subunit IIA [Treponema sp.]